MQPLEDSSEAIVFHQIVLEKLFINNKIKDNLLGVAHDNAPTLCGVRKGLVSLLRQDMEQFLFSLPDPCHSLALILKKSLSVLPKEVMFFIEKIHSHFQKFPQRKARLSKIQEELGEKQLGLLRYKENRWLSLGESVARLLQIWKPLSVYMENFEEKGEDEDEDYDDYDYEESESQESCNKEGKKKTTIEKLKELIGNKQLYLMLQLLNSVVAKINKSNELFQSQNLRIEKLKTEMIICFRGILNFTLKPEKYCHKVEELIEIKWERKDNQKEWFLPYEEFINGLSLIIKKESQDYLKSLSGKEQENFTNGFYKFISKILSLCTEYLPFKDPIIRELDLVCLVGSPDQVFAKFMNFNKFFKVIPEEKLGDLKNELNILMAPDIYYLERSDTLSMWDYIDNEGHFPYSVQIAKAAQSLPSSSAVVEQAFSLMKLIKTDQRYRLSESALQGLIFLKQEYSQNNVIQIREKNIINFQHTRDQLNKRKSGINELTQSIKKEKTKEDMQEERKKNNTQSNSRRQSPKSQNFPKENEDLDREKKEEVNQALTPKKSLKRKDPPEENENGEGLGEKLSDFKNHKKKKTEKDKPEGNESTKISIKFDKKPS